MAHSEAEAIEPFRHVVPAQAGTQSLKFNYALWRPSDVLHPVHHIQSENGLGPACAGTTEGSFVKNAAGPRALNKRHQYRFSGIDKLLEADGFRLSRMSVARHLWHMHEGGKRQ